MQAIWALVKKDLIQYFSNRRAVLVNIIAPILIASFFGYVFGGNRESEPTRIAVLVLDQDQSDISRDVLHNLEGNTELKASSADASSAAEALGAGKVTALITIPKGFGVAASRALFAGPPLPEIELHYDPSQKIALQVVRGLLAQDVMQSVTKSVFSGNTALQSDWRARIDNNAALPEQDRRDLANLFDSLDRVQRDNSARGSSSAAGAGPGSIASQGLKLPYATLEAEASREGQDDRYNGYAHSFAGMGVQFILFMGIDLGIGLLVMRRLDIWKRLKAAPLSKTTLLTSRMLSCAIIALSIFSVIFAAAILIFGVRIEGSVPGFIGVLLAFAAMTSSFGLMIAALGRSPEATRGLAIVTTLVLVMLGGAWVPAFVFPQWLQQVSLIAPTRWAVDGLDAMTWRGLGFSHALLPIAIMLGFGVLFAAVAIWRFDWDE